MLKIGVYSGIRGHDLREVFCCCTYCERRVYVPLPPAPLPSLKTKVKNVGKFLKQLFCLHIYIREAIKKVIFLVALPLRPCPPPRELQKNLFSQWPGLYFPPPPPLLVATKKMDFLRLPLQIYIIFFSVGRIFHEEKEAKFNLDALGSPHLIQKKKHQIIYS